MIALEEDRDWAEALNRACACFSVSREGLVEALRGAPGVAGLGEGHAHLVAGAPVFISAEEASAIDAFARDLDRLTELPAYRRAALSWAAPLGDYDPGIAGGLLGLDFHLSPQGPRLIEVNTNPGGVLINAELTDALRGCCPAADAWLPRLPTAAEVRGAVFEVFAQEWRSARPGAPAPCVAIVDEQPESQYLYPEFRLFQTLFESHGWPTAIHDPAELQWTGQELRAGGRRLDLVYNRLTDFSLEAPRLAPLRQAYERNGVVLTPHPHAHARYADKRLLSLLSDAQALQQLGCEPALARRVAARVPATRRVRAHDSEALWQQRKQYYFKPARGYGSKATYDGAKLTRATFQQILGGEYLAQERVPPPQRADGDQVLKYDVRAYAYRGEVLLMAARLYRGQTTNFRSAGGGFAPVVVVPGGRPCADCGAAEVDAG